MSTPRRANSFEIKQGDTEPALETTLMADGEPMDLTEASGVALRMSLCRHPYTIKIDLEPVTFQATGEVRYEWQPGDTDTIGEYDVEWVVTFPPNHLETVPSKGFDKVEVTRHGGPMT